MLRLALLLLFTACGSDDPTDTDRLDDDTDIDTADVDTGVVALCDAPGAVSVSGTAHPGLGNLTMWDASDCATSYEVAVGTVDGEDDVLPWTDVGDVTEYDWGELGEPLLPVDTPLVTRVRSVEDGRPGEVAASTSWTVWSPAELAELMAWYDAADTDTVRRATACAELAVEGEQVTCWLDRSGNEAHMTQGVWAATNAPIPPPTHSALPDGRDVIAFDIGQLLFTPDTPVLTPSGGITMVVVDAPDNPSDTEHHYVLNKNESYELAYFEGTLNAAIETPAGQWAWLSPPDTRASALQLNIVSYDTSEVYWRLNGQPAGSVANNHSGDIRHVPNPLMLGGRIYGNGGVIRYAADLGEVILIQGVLSNQELADLERHLMEKWNITGGTTR